jgi:hypothetical protein
MARTKIDDLAQDAEELEADEKQEVKGGAVPVVNAAVVTGVAGASAVAAGAAAALAAQRRTQLSAAEMPVAQENTLSNVQTSPLFTGVTDGTESPLKKSE